MTTYQGTQYAHTVNGGLNLVAVSPDRLNFSGTGEYNGQAGATWAISGHVKDNEVRFEITYDGTLNPGYKADAIGTIAVTARSAGRSAR